MESATARAPLRQARKQAGLSQADLAARAGVTERDQCVHESGQRQPSVSALARLVGTAGFELALGMRRPPGRLRRLHGGEQHDARLGRAIVGLADGVDRPGDLGGSDPWKDAESCLHSGSTPMSCANAR